MNEEEIRERLKTHNLAALSRVVPVSHNTLVRFRKGHVKPNAATVKALSDYLTGDGK